MTVDFDVDDAIDKLDDLGLLVRRRRGRIEVASLAEALVRVDRRWDDLFDFPVVDGYPGSPPADAAVEGLLSRLLRRATGRDRLTPSTGDAAPRGGAA